MFLFVHTFHNCFMCKILLKLMGVSSLGEKRGESRGERRLRRGTTKSRSEQSERSRAELSVAKREREREREPSEEVRE